MKEKRGEGAGGRKEQERELASEAVRNETAPLEKVTSRSVEFPALFKGVRRFSQGEKWSLEDHLLRGSKI